MSISQMTTEQRKRMAQALKEWLPWLGTDNEVSCADEIDRMSELYHELQEPGRPPAAVATPSHQETIGELLDVAYDDQRHWIDYGNPRADYKDDLDSADVKVERYRSYARLAESLGIHGEPERWNELADQFLNAVKGEN